MAVKKKIFIRNDLHYVFFVSISNLIRFNYLWGKNGEN